MSAPEPKRHIVRPFGLIGGRYEVDDAGARKYWLACGIAAVFVALLIFSDPLGVPVWGLVIAAVISFAATYALCADVVRKGRKL